MIRLGLLGKNIAHSKSKEVYERILKTPVEYHLFDYPAPDLIPELDFFFEKVDGLSITSPYKKIFIDRGSIGLTNLKTPSINCVKKSQGIFEATNTDYLAVDKIVSNLFNEKKELEIIILGSGAMSQITRAILDKKGVEYKVYARDEKNPDLNLLDYKYLHCQDKTPLIINSCSRDFIFKAEIPENTIFWDFNYSLEAHQQRLSSLCDYRDGLHLLELQAFYALMYWGISELTTLE